LERFRQGLCGIDAETPMTLNTASNKSREQTEYQKKEAQLTLEKAHRTAYVWNPTSDFQSQRENNFSVWQFRARYANGTLLTKATLLTLV